MFGRSNRNAAEDSQLDHQMRSYLEAMEGRLISHQDSRLEAVETRMHENQERVLERFRGIETNGHAVLELSRSRR
jgi:hypothetical protein